MKRPKIDRIPKEARFKNLMAYRVGSHATRVDFDVCPDAYFLIRPISPEYFERLAEYHAAVRSELGLEAEAELPTDRAQECHFRALCGTRLIGWGGWEIEDGVILEGRQGSLNPDHLNKILGADDPEILAWFAEACRRIDAAYIARISGAEGKSAPLAAGTEPGAEALAN